MDAATLETSQICYLSYVIDLYTNSLLTSVLHGRMKTVLHRCTWILQLCN